jgi:starch phosphorylase
MNEGHPALAALELAAQQVAAGVPLEDALEAARQRVVFTTHTPVAAGNETYPADDFSAAFSDLANRLGIDGERFLGLCRIDPDDSGEQPGMTPLALRLSRKRNAVSRLHGEVSREMWKPLFGASAAADVPITHVTNGVHVPTFVSAPMRRLLDAHLGEGWAASPDPRDWEAVRTIPNEALWAARNETRRDLVDYVRAKNQQDRLLRGEELGYVRAISLDPDALTLGFARRLATYKRLHLLAHDPERAERLIGGEPGAQLLVAGKAHPSDEAGKDTLQSLFELKRRSSMAQRIVVLEDYDLDVARRLVAGCDVWINLPRRPLEASGTSGMKSTFNGGLQLSVLDGWWAEAYDGTNGWAIPGEEDADPAAADARDAERFYDLLEREVIPLFHDRDANGVPHAWCERIKDALVSCGPQFSATRMLDDYVERIYPDA